MHMDRPALSAPPILNPCPPPGRLSSALVRYPYLSPIILLPPCSSRDPTQFASLYHDLCSRNVVSQLGMTDSPAIVLDQTRTFESKDISGPARSLPRSPNFHPLLVPRLTMTAPPSAPLASTSVPATRPDLSLRPPVQPEGYTGPKGKVRLARTPPNNE